MKYTVFIVALFAAFSVNAKGGGGHGGGGHASASHTASHSTVHASVASHPSTYSSPLAPRATGAVHPSESISNAPRVQGQSSPHFWSNWYIPFFNTPKQVSNTASSAQQQCNPSVPSEDCKK